MEGGCGCGCDHGPLRGILGRTLETTILLFVITFVLELAVHSIGTDRLATIMLKDSVFQPIICAVIGLIPSCAISVVLTQLYTSGVIGMGSLIAGLSTGAGFGYMVLLGNENGRRTRAPDHPGHAGLSPSAGGTDRDTSSSRFKKTIPRRTVRQGRDGPTAVPVFLACYPARSSSSASAAQLGVDLDKVTRRIQALGRRPAGCADRSVPGHGDVLLGAVGQHGRKAELRRALVEVVEDELDDVQVVLELQEQDELHEFDRAIVQAALQNVDLLAEGVQSRRRSAGYSLRAGRSGRSRASCRRARARP